MKIINLSFSNINSLIGDWFIDFADPAFADGLFVLTGPTGAGKTSVLDSICLALYGRSVREEISKEHNEVMTRGTGQCRAEAVFEVDNRRYRCRWSQKRAHCKPDGVLQNAERDIADAVSGEVIASQIRQVDVKIAELTGMSFDQFTRAVLLAQGQFDTFLKAKENERADILEKITRTGIYSGIGAAVFARFQDENRKRGELERDQEALAIMTAEDRGLLDGQLAAAKARQTAALAELDSLGKQMEWLDKIAHLRGEQDKLAVQRRALDQRCTDSKPELARLALAESARRFDLDLLAIDNARETCDKSRKELAGRITQASDSTNKLSDAKTKLAAIAPLAEAARQDLENTKPNLDAARQLDKKIGLAAQEKSSAGTAFAEAQQHWKDADTAQTKAIERRAAAESELASATEYLQGHVLDGKIGDLLPAIEADNSAWRTLRSSAMDLLVLATEGEGKAAKAALKAESAHEKQTTDAQAATSAQTNYDAQVPGLLAANTARETAETAKSGAVSALDAQKPILETQLGLADKSVLLAQQVASLEECRKQLKDGEPCQLCGATEHPYARGNMPELSAAERERRAIKSKIELLEKSARDAGDRLDSADRTWRRLQEGMDQLAKLRDAAQNQAKLSGQAAQAAVEVAKSERKQADEATARAKAASDKVEKAWSEIATRLAELSVPKPNPDEWEGILKGLRKRQSDFESQAKLAQSATIRIQEGQKAIEEAKRRVEAASAALAAKQIEFTHKSEALDLLVRERHSLYGELDPDAEEKRLRTAKDQTGLALQAIETEKVSLEGAVAGADREVVAAQSALASAESRLHAALTNGAGKWQSADLPDETACRNARWTDSDVNRVSALKRELQEVDARLKTQSETYAQLLGAETAKAMTDRTSAELAEDIQIKREARKQDDEMLSGLELKVGIDEANRAKQAEQGAALEAQKIVFARWNKLNDMIGTSGGARFKKYAQGITLNRLLKVANPHLADMTNCRYALQWVVKGGEDLLPSIIDNHQADAVRPITNLSGGETFMVSLALALALSGMAGGKLRVDSLFLDEGFGTLDSVSLDLAIGTLKKLHQSQGKLIGVISHLDQLKTQIGTKIEVTKIGNGRSKLSGPGVRSVKVESTRDGEISYGQDKKPKKRGRPPKVQGPEA